MVVNGSCWSEIYRLWTFIGLIELNVFFIVFRWIPRLYLVNAVNVTLFFLLLLQYTYFYTICISRSNSRRGCGTGKKHWISHDEYENGHFLSLWNSLGFIKAKSIQTRATLHNCFNWLINAHTFLDSLKSKPHPTPILENSKSMFRR